MDGRTLFFEWEVSLMSRIQDQVGPFGVTLSRILSMLGEEVILLLIFGLIYWCLDKKAAKQIGTCLVIGIMVNPLIKNVVLRRRPYFDHESIDCLKPVNDKADPYDITFQGYSFPSAHTLNSTIMYASLWRTWKNTIFKIIAIAVPILVAVSRVALGNHYPTDVIVGGILGLAVAFLVPVIQKRFRSENHFRIVILAISLLGLFYCRTDDYFTGLGMMMGFFVTIPFEEKYVSFKETRQPVECIIRLIGGCLIYYVSNTLLKLPFSKEFLASDQFSAHLVRATRYTVIVFLMFAIYPMLFRFIRIGKETSVN